MSEDGSGDEGSSSGSKKPRLTRAAAKRENIQVVDSNSRDSLSTRGSDGETKPPVVPIITTEKPQMEKDEGPSSYGRGSVMNPYSEGVIHVGQDYQVVIPPLVSGGCEMEEKCVCLWAPPKDDKLSDMDVHQFCTTARDQFGFAPEQSLGLLHWHGFNVPRALGELNNYIPFREDWSTEDKVLFEQAFSFHGKNFTRIKQLLPHKSMASLVDYYYLWKKSRHYTSYMDKKSDGEESDGYDPEPLPKSPKRKRMKPDCTECSNCQQKCLSLTKLGTAADALRLCKACHMYWQRTGGQMRPFTKGRKDGDEHKKGQNWPFSWRVEMKHFEEFAKPTDSTDSAQKKSQEKTVGETYLKTLDFRIHGLRSKAISRNGQTKAVKKQSLTDAMKEFKLDAAPKTRTNNKWTDMEKLLAVQGFRRYGLNYSAIGEVLGTKSADMVKHFYKEYNAKYKLDSLVKEYEKCREETKLQMETKKNDAEIIEIDLDDEPTEECTKMAPVNGQVVA